MVSKARALELRMQGKTYECIGDLFGVSRQRIHQIITGYKPKNFRIAQRDWRKRFQQTERGKKQHREAIRGWRIEVKRLVLRHYGGNKLRCIGCGCKDMRVLSIDHIDGNGAEHKRTLGIQGGTNLYRWLISNSYPSGYQTLCMNCQWIKRYENSEHH